MRILLRYAASCLVVMTAAFADFDLHGATFPVASPDGKTRITVLLDETDGSLSYRVTSRDVPIVDKSPLGLTTDLADFTAGLVYVGSHNTEIDETYTLPQGKVSSYHNRANQLTLHFNKSGHGFDVIFRAYDDGVAFRYAIGGEGPITISAETTGFWLSGEPAYWGQEHPNRCGYENDLGRIDGPDFSLALLCEYKEPERWVLLAQAATYGSYCLPHLHNEGGLLRFRFPLDQKEPIKTALPFDSPWRVRVFGAFLVSSRLADGEVEFVRITSERGRPCRFENPWPGGLLKLSRDNGDVEEYHGAYIDLEIDEGETILLEDHAHWRKRQETLKKEPRP